MSNMIVYYWMAAVNKLSAIKSQKGVAMMEYALLAALIAVAAIAVLPDLGNQVEAAFTEVSNAFTDAGIE